MSIPDLNISVNSELVTMVTMNIFDSNPSNATINLTDTTTTGFIHQSSSIFLPGNSNAQEITFTEQEYQKEQSIAGVFITIYIIFIFVIVVGNTGVIVLVLTRKALRTPTNFYIVSLCVSDIAVGVFAITDDILAHYDESFMTDGICKGLEYIVHVALTSNICTVLCIAVDRFRAVIYPFTFKAANKQCVVSICLAWIVSLLYSIRVIFMYSMVREQHLSHGEWHTYHQCSIPHTATKLMHDFVVVDFFIMYIIPLVIINIVHGIIIRKIRRDNLTVGPQQLKKKNLSRTKRQSRVVKMLLAITLVFTICQLPNQVYKIYRYWHGVFKGFLIVHQVCDIITFSNSWINVIIYVLLNDNFVKALTKCVYRSKKVGVLAKTVSAEREQDYDSGTVRNSSYHGYSHHNYGKIVSSMPLPSFNNANSCIYVIPEEPI